jgi:DNA-binding MarR family transcriptional regulator
MTMPGEGGELLVAGMMRAGMVLRREFAVRLYEAGLSPMRPVDVELMRVLAEEPWISQTLLSERLRVRRQSVELRVELLEFAGLVEVQHSAGGRRSTSCALTEEGLRRLRAAWEVLQGLEWRFLGSLPEERAQELLRHLPDALRAIDRREARTIFDVMR